MQDTSDRPRTAPPGPASRHSPMPVKALGAYLALALLLGGAGISYPLITALIEALALLLLAYAAWTRGAARLLAPGATANMLLLAILLLPLLQLVPLPWSSWLALPAHGLAASILDLAGLSGSARPASLDPHATLVAWLSLLPAATVFLLASRLPPAEQRRLVGIAIGAALLSALLGAVQKASGGVGPAILFPSDHSANGPGLFVDRNHQACFMLMAMPLAAGVARSGAARAQSPVRLIALGLVVVLGAATVATTSRMGILLLPLAALAAVLILFPPRMTMVRMALPLAGLALAAWGALQSSGVRAVLDRFAAHDVRFDYWADTWIGIRQAWPIGTGFGSFQDVYPSLENLDIVGTAIVYNAHNDFLQLLLEGGLAALLLMLGFLVLIVILAIRVWRTPLPPGVGAMKAAAFAAILLLLLSSISEYPLRMFSILILFALLSAILAAAPPRRRQEPREAPASDGESKRPSKPGPALRIASTAVCALLLAMAVMEGLAAHFLLTGHIEQALALAPGEWRASFAEAVSAAEHGDFTRAQRHARSALAAAPMRPEPATVLALAAQSQGQREQAARMITAIASLGWRHAPAQLWMLQSALAQDNVETAVLRADALLRQGVQVERLVPLLRRLAHNPRAAGLIADRLAADPPWRPAYLEDIHALRPEDFTAHGTLLAGLRGSEGPPKADEIKAFSDRLLAGRRFAEAEVLWRTLAPAPRGSLDSGSPFGWTSRPIPSLDVAVAPAGPGGSPALTLTADGSVAGAAVDRLLLLSPGRYTLHSEMSPIEAADALRWRFACEVGQADLATGPARILVREEGVASETDFAVPPACAAIRATLWIDHPLPATGTFVVRDIAIRRWEPGERYR